MGIFDRFKGHKDKAKEMSDRLEQEANTRTGNKYEKQVDQAQQEAEKRLGIDDDPNR
ncbi:antitoxin [Streptomyces sp. NPDC090022]|uniref:antitoxin n=1 Tax=Streptomyces sp. NPDC090022 TaxID=3365920 RepID=UPI003809EC48